MYNLHLVCAMPSSDNWNCPLYHTMYVPVHSYPFLPSSYHTLNHQIFSATQLNKLLFFCNFCFLHQLMHCHQSCSIIPTSKNGTKGISIFRPLWQTANAHMLYTQTMAQVPGKPLESCTSTQPSGCNSQQLHIPQPQSAF